MSQQQELLNIIEAALLAAGRPLDLGEMIALFEGQEDVPSRARLREVIVQLQEDWNERSLELIEVATGFRFQVRAEYAAWMGRLWAERPAAVLAGVARNSRAHGLPAAGDASGD